MDAAIFDKMVSAIRGFEMTITALRPTFKLSQNKLDDERERVARTLITHGEPEIAEHIRAFARK